MANGVQTKPPLQHFPPRADESFRVTEFRDRATGCSWHFHPEYQLSLVLEGHGMRVIGDSNRKIRPGEVTLLGPNLPHLWKYAPGSQIHAVVVHFTDRFAGADLMNRPEATPLRLLLARSTSGLEVKGEIRKSVQESLLGLVDQKGLTRTLHLLEILNSISQTTDTSPISPAAASATGLIDLERLRCVYDHVNENLHATISREEVARLSHLTPSAFSRFFRQHTGSTFQEFLTEKRIGRACELLLDANLNISDIAFDCGFATPTSFTRAFRRARGKSPTEFREELRAILVS